MEETTCRPHTHTITDTPRHTDIDRERFGHQTLPNHPQDVKRHSQNVIKCSRTGCRWRVLADRTSNQALFLVLPTHGYRSDKLWTDAKAETIASSCLPSPPLTTWMMCCASVAGNREGGRTCALSISATTVYVVSWARRASLIASRFHCPSRLSRFWCRTGFHFYQRKYGPGHALTAEVLVRRSRKNVHRKQNE